MSQVQKWTKVFSYLFKIKFNHLRKNETQLKEWKKKIIFNLLFLFRPFLNKYHVVRHHVLAQQVFRDFRESLDLRDQQVLQDHMGIVDPKDPWVREGERAMKAPEADAVSQGPKELRDSRDQPVLEEAEAKKALGDLKGPQVQKELLGC